MSIQISIERPKDVVQAALVQFAARRSYQLTEPWWADVTRLEKPAAARTSDGTIFGPQKPGWSERVEDALLDVGLKRPRVDLNLKQKTGRTIVQFKLGRHEGSTALAYELQRYLLSELAYSAECPAVCPRCAEPVRNIHANYCGRCGLALTGASAGANRREEPVRIERVGRASEDEPAERSAMGQADQARDSIRDENWVPPVPRLVATRTTQANVGESRNASVSAGEDQAAEVSTESAGIAENRELEPMPEDAGAGAAGEVINDAPSSGAGADESEAEEPPVIPEARPIRRRALAED